MAEGIVADKILEAFGGEFFTGDQTAGSQWSPNMYKNLYILDDAVVTETHFGKFEAIPVLDPDTLDPEEAEEVFNIRRLGCLEGIFVSPGAGGIGVAEMVSRFFRVGRVRLHAIGEVDGMGAEGPLVSTKHELPGSDGWEGRYELQAEHYSMDSEGGKLWSVLQKAAEDSGAGDSDEGSEDDEHASATPDSVEDENDTYELVKGYYSDTTNGTINKIIREYTKIFSSGFEVITPAGVLMENDRGYGVLGHINGTTLEKDRVNRNLQMLYAYLRDHMNLTEVPVRSIKDIANVIVSGSVKPGGKKYSGNLVFPYKIMEYAFGRRRVAKSDSSSIENYQEHSKRANWESYARDEVAESLRDVMLYVVWISLKKEGFDHEPESPQANQVATEILNRFQKAFCTAILVSKYDTSRGNLVAVKVRVLDPSGDLPRDRNILEEVISKSHGAIDDSDKKLVYPVQSNGSYIEYNLELDSKLANAEPLFAYKALEKILEQGQKVNYNNAIFGKDSNDKILRNGGRIDLNKKLSHAVVAGSRAGKGVWTFSILAGSCLSKRPIFYIDNKPDMASLFRHLAPNGFVVNGANITTDPQNGTDYFSQYEGADSWINPTNVPGYVQSLLGGSSYRNLGAFIYAKALTLTMGILAARVEVPSKINELGGPEGIVVVVDELANANINLMAQFGTFNQHVANTGYYNELKTQIEEGEGGKINADKPKPEDYWFTHFYQDMQKSLNRLQALSNAGLKNVEANRSDVFILTQEPPEMITSAGQVSELFRKPNKNSNAIAGGIDNPRILPSFALVGGTDVFVGYDKDNRAFLDQGNKSSKAFPYLNEVNRNFGYLSQYGPDVRDKFNTSALADRALYYKPMLLFADGKTDSYFVRNALGYAEMAGIEDPQDIVRRNEDPNNPGEINPAVGFEGYLNKAGMSSEEISSSLSSSGEIAQRVADALGYEGSWQELLFDFRPEWMFTVDDIIAAMKGQTLSSTLEKRMEDFITVYPEAFETSFTADEDLMGEYQDDDGADLMGGYDDGDRGTADVEDDFDDDFEDDFDDEPQFMPQESSDEDEDGYDSHEAAPVEAGIVDYRGALGREDFRSDKPAQSGDTAEFGSPEEAYESLPSHIPPLNVDTVDLSEADTEELEEHQEPSLVVDWSDPNSVAQAQAYLEQRLRSGDIDTSTADSKYGNGFHNTPSGVADNYRPHGGAQQVAPTTPLDLREPRTVADLVNNITQGAYRVVGGGENLRSVRVIDGLLIVNNVAYRPELSDEYLENVPYDLVRELRSGNVARLFAWETLTRVPKVRRLAFDSPEFISDYVSDALGWKGRVSVPSFFERFRVLQHLTIGKHEYTRDNFRMLLKEDTTYYQPQAMRAVADTLDRSFSRGTASSWNYTRTTLSRKDIGLAGKFFGVTAGLTGAAVAGTAAVTTKGTKGLFSGMRQGFRSMHDALNDTKRFK